MDFESFKNKLEKKIKNSFDTHNKKTSAQIEKNVLTPDSTPRNQVEDFLKNIISNVIKLPPSRIRKEEPFEKYGIDSLMIVNLNQELEKYFGELPKTLFFEYKTLHELTNYFLEFHASAIKEKFQPATAMPEKKTLSQSSTRVKEDQTDREKTAYTTQDIAIIGIAGRYPEANTIEEFWQNLKSGKDSIIEIPKERWDFHLYFDPDKEKIGKSYGKWGAFIDDVDKFDALFFNISPSEAELIDPQERIFLETAYHAVEDAGYDKNLLADKKVGVFVGVMYGQYQLFGAEESLNREVSVTGSSYSSIANRVSYFCNFRGPSIALDTMCSSSLSAIHLACQSIRNGECDLAVAGGVNVTIHPNKYLFLSQGRFLSSDGRCKSFGETGDGYVPGEGVGAILLKSLTQALLDKDHIYGIIKGSSLNHGGKTNGFSVPNPVEQASVIAEACKDANINPETISYIEAHGTGTSLGDPIEIAGLSKVFSMNERDVPYALGSVKSNVGHLEAAAGIVALTKVLLQMKYQTLVPSLHSEKLNKNINWNKIPFKVQQETQAWQLPLIGGKTYLRRASISSFGAGGSNAHLIIEEAPFVDVNEEQTKPYYLVTLSAKTMESLQKRIKDLSEWLTKEAEENLNLEIISYNLNARHTHFEKRCALVVKSIDELKESLDKLQKNETSDNIYLKTDLKNKPSDQEQFNLIFLQIIKELDKEHEENYKNKLLSLADYYVQGYDLNWQKIQKDEFKQKISLPHYPFIKKHYWYQKAENKFKQSHIFALHPLLDSNESTLSKTIFKKILDPNAFYLRDHIVKGQQLLPGSAYVEIARAAGSIVGEQAVQSLKEVIWLKPIIIAQSPLPIFIEFFAEENGASYQIYSEITGEQQVHCEGRISYEQESLEQTKLDITSIRKRCNHSINKNEIYQHLQGIGFDYGPSFQVTKRIDSNDQEALAELELPIEAADQAAKYVLHPSLLDGAFRTILGIYYNNGQPFNLRIPFSMDKLVILKPINAKCVVYAKFSATLAEDAMQKIDIIISDEYGDIAVVIQGFSGREFKPNKIAKQESQRPNEKTQQEKMVVPPAYNLKQQDDDLYKLTEKYLKDIFFQVVKVPVNEIESHKLFEDYGIDSIMILKFNSVISKDFSKLRKTLLFEYRTIESLAKYLVKEQRAQVENVLGWQSKSQEQIKSPEISPQKTQLTKTATLNKSSKRIFHSAVKASSARDEIAVIGVSGRYPQANNLEEFWSNLKAGKDCIEEVPSMRWDYRKFYDTEKGKNNKTYSKWGGFIADADKFDAAFFNMTPHDAELEDPEERLMLQTVWAAIEDAGYYPQSLQEASQGRVGVFVGLMWNEYPLFLQHESAETLLYGSSNVSGLANRISYFFNLQGPSLVIDTACSSSLVAVHMACESILRGECDYALAGGVNLSLHPSKYVNLSQLGMLASDGRCRSFGANGDGYVPGEGVGVVLLKRLSQALHDKDIIYGVIKGSHVNHGGKTSSFTVPNPDAHAALIATAMQKANVEPQSVSYIEAHGTGTALGDPIEVTGLSKAFGETVDKQSCAMGSVKSNIGHLEGAAGIAALTKVLLQLKHKQLVPSLHSEKLNPHIDFTETPFYIQHELSEWKAKHHYPLRAGISSFGAGGTNAHVLLEEAPLMQSTQRQIMKPAYLITLSAKTQESLQQKLLDLNTWLETQNDKPALEDISYTLNARRNHFDKRCAIVVNSLAELRETLEKINKGQKPQNSCLVSKKETSEYQPIFAEILEKLINDIHDQTLDAANYSKKLLALGDLYTQGYDIDWKRLHDGETKNKLSLPTYPFMKKRYWASSEGIQFAQNKRAALQPLLDSNESNLREIRFKKSLDPSAFYLRDHVVKGEMIVPGTVYLEMARAAGCIAGQAQVQALKEIFWLQPIFVKEALQPIYISLLPDESQATFQIYSEHNDEKILHCEGQISYEKTFNESSLINIEEIRKRCDQSITKADVYAYLKKLGFEYGPAFQVTKYISYNHQEVLAELEMPEEISAEAENYVLHPSLLDGALRVVLGLFYARPQKSLTLSLPFSMDDLIILKPIRSPTFVYAKPSKEETLEKIDVTLTNEQGEIAVLIKGFAVREFKKTASESTIFLYQPSWFKEEKANNLPAADSAIIFAKKDIPQTLWENVVKKIIWVRPGESYKKITENEFSIRPESKNDYEQLLKDLIQSGIDVKNILHMWNCSGAGKWQDATWETQLNTGLYSLFYLFQALDKTCEQESELRCLFVYKSIEAANQPQHDAIAGLMHSLKLVKPFWQTANIEISDELYQTEDGVNKLINELEIKEFEVRYAMQDRFVRRLEKLNEIENVSPSLKQGGVYLLTGGLGGLGRLFADYLVTHFQARLILLGRRPLTKNTEKIIADWKKQGSDVLYVQGDVSHTADVDAMLAQVKTTFGDLNGIFHAAGVLSEELFGQTTLESFKKVLAPKIQGTWNLDYATRTLPLDFFTVFSSTSAELGDYGVGGYAAGNRFMDSYMLLRDKLQQAGLRQGKSLSINWPYWREGGMQLPEEEGIIYFNYSGMQALESAEGLALFSHLLSLPYPNIFVAKGDAVKIERVLGIKNQVQAKTFANSSDTLIASNTELYSATENYLKVMFARVTKMPANEIDSQQLFESYGIDSVMILKFNGEISKDFAGLRKTLLFEHRTLESLAHYLIKEQWAGLEKVLGRKKVSSEAQTTAVKPFSPPTIISKKTEGPTLSEKNITDGIAIIGISGRYPHAKNLAEFWENLKSGKDCIDEIPKERWDYQQFYNPKKRQPEKMYSKWGGFITDADKFDALFFNISPLEAEVTDPQERLMLETAWSAIESAGYSPEILQQENHGRVGVFVGCMWNEYQLLLEHAGSASPLFGNSNTSSLANRISYFLDLHGPSLVIDTACSSSLVAVHMACESILRGECDYAIAGGVNLSLHPSKYVNLCQMEMLSSDGRCRSFGAGGDGYVPGEGVGVILLKSLQKALQDGDTIYAVIKGSDVNHGGRTNGYMVPNPDAQADLIRQAVKKAGVDQKTISYVEAHGTGTALGDPIEITGLCKAFGEEIAKQSCALGSVKSNVGHLEGAAGISALTKVVMQLMHKKLVPSLHASELNPHIDFEKTPFYVQRECCDWESQPGKMRRAGISSFGAGGTNVHVVLEEAPVHSTSPSPINKSAYLITLSAKTEAALQEQVVNLQSWLEENTAALADISYTLNARRSHFEKRCVMVVSSLEELKETLHKIQQNDIPSNYLFNKTKGKSRPEPVLTELLSRLITEIASYHSLEKESYRQKLLALGDLYIKGYKINWEQVHKDETKKKIPLPTYPFARDRYWVPEKKSMPQAYSQEPTSATTPTFSSTTTLNQVEIYLSQKLAEILKLKSDDVDIEKNLSEYGMDSIHFTALTQSINENYNIALTPALFYGYGNIKEMAHYLMETFSEAIQQHQSTLGSSPLQSATAQISSERQEITDATFDQHYEPIAIIGMHGIFPQSKNLDDFWKHLQNGDDLITEIPSDRWDWQKYYPDKTNSKWGAFIEGIDLFDPDFFNISQREAELMDPQHRLFLTTVWKAIEDAGYNPYTFSNHDVGIFAGVEFNEYQELFSESDKLNAYVATGNSHTMLANRISYLLNLHGPSEAIDTACSSALVAVHRAVTALQRKECKLAIAGAVCLMIGPNTFVGTSQMGVFSADGRCKTFDKRANGYVKGEGVAALLLKPLAQAYADGDNIYGIIRASAVNHGGKSQSITAPNPVSQAQVLEKAYRLGGINPSTLTYIETHGTGTVLGDPIEIEGLKLAFAQFPETKKPNPYCGLGSVKTNIGHLEPAAGIAGLIKVLLAMHHKQLPANVHFAELNPHIRISDSPFYIVEKTKGWDRLQDEEGNLIPLRAGISSFGFGGMNAHVVIEEAPSPEASTEATAPYYLITLSAKTETALQQQVMDLYEWLVKQQAPRLANISYTLNTGRNHFQKRLALVVASLAELHEALQKLKNQQKSATIFSNLDSNDKPKDQAIFKELSKQLIKDINHKDQLSQNDYRDKLCALANFYIQGYELDWKDFYSGKKLQKISLPTYPFMNKRCWVSASKTVTTEKKKTDVCYYQTVWHPQKLENKFDVNSITGPVLLFDDEGRLTKKFINKFPHLTILSAKSEGDFNINEMNAKDYTQLFAQLQERHLFPKQIIYCVTSADAEQNFFQLLYLTQALMQQNPKESMTITYLNQVTEPYSVLLTNSLSAFAKSAHLEHPKLNYQVLEIHNAKPTLTFLQDLNSNEDVIRYDKDHIRSVKRYQEMDHKQTFAWPLKKNGVYLITGGMGGLGLLFARYLARHYQARLVLIGRSEMNEKQKNMLAEMESLGAKVIYIRADITQKNAMKNVLMKAKERFGQLNGVIHSAGVIQDSFITTKTLEQARQVLAPKITGTLNLDEVTQSEPLDFFVMFSSIASIFGNVGQSDYAYANGFMDAFVEFRETLQHENRRQGKTISINWPLWAEGGMKIDKATQQWMEKTAGMLSLATEDGIDAFNMALAQHISHLIVLSGYRDKISQIMAEKILTTTIHTHEITLLKEVQLHLVNAIADLLKIAISKIGIEQNLSEYGMDSLNFTALANQIKEKYRISVTPAMFYGHNNILSISRYLLETFPTAITNHYSNVTPATIAISAKNAEQITLPPSAQTKGQIAIIGVHGIFPQANDLDTFWKHLKACRDLIIEIPSDRWDWHDYYGDAKQDAAKTNSKWGGFIEGVDLFDAAFFKISPLEAEFMDPQHRLMLETVWKTIEDAGYDPQSLANQNVGIFVGMEFSEYQEFLPKNESNAYVATGNSHIILPNRISYLLNLHGPSEPIETGSSSSLVAIYHAIAAIQRGDCTLAIAGGVNLLLSPHTFVTTSQMGVLSPDGRCKTFDKRANGYVKGEGVAALLLKPLEQAMADGDHIYGVIRACAVNHGGKAQSLTAPNSIAQAQLLEKVYREANVDPATITYIETHGTGTALGDPVEIEGLKSAFSKFGSASHTMPYCGLGAVKTNIGHLEPAAGIAGVIKVLLAMQHGYLPGNANFKELNPYIEIKDSPFYILEKTERWQRLKDTNGKIIPRRAGVSSFGFGGVNAHVVIEEAPNPNHDTTALVSTKPYYLITLSAKTDDALQQRIIDLETWLSKKSKTTLAKINLLENISYTLNTGRSHFEKRCAFVVNSINELKEKLKQFKASDLFNPAKKTVSKKQLQKMMQNLSHANSLSTQAYQEILLSLANYYLQGHDLDWPLLHQNESRQRISLPSYPFAKERYWITATQNAAVRHTSIHALIDANISTMEAQQFSKLFTGKEFYLNEHRVNNTPVLPGVAYLEMARAAGSLAFPNKKVIGLRNIIWATPIKIQDHQDKNSIIRLSSQESGIAFEISTQNNDVENTTTLHSQGKILYGENKANLAPVSIDIENLKQHFTHKQTAETIYSRFKALGLHYGQGFQVIQYILTNDSEAISKITLPIHLQNTHHQFLLHPSLMDGALQTILGLKANAATTDALYLPFSMAQVDIYGPLPQTCYVYVKAATMDKTSLPKFDIQIMNEQGNSLVHIKDFTLRALQAKISTPDISVHYYQPIWEKRPAVKKQETRLDFADPLLIFDNEGEMTHLVKEKFPQKAVVNVKFGDSYQALNNNEYQLNASKPDDFIQLLNDLEKRYLFPKNIIYHADFSYPANGLEKEIQDKLQHCFYSLFYLSQALIQRKPKNEIKILCVNVQKAQRPSLFFQPLSGFAKTLHAEYPALFCHSINIPTLNKTTVDCLLQEFINDEYEVRYDNDQVRWFKHYQEISPNHSDHSHLGIKKGGIYLITGGAGGLGLKFSRYLAQQYQAKLALLGRSPLNAKQNAIITELEKLGSQVMYVQADVTNKNELKRAVDKIKDRFGELNGIIHSAGVIHDSFLIKKTTEEISAVLAPKIFATVYLDELTQSQPLDFFVMFSSISSIFGNLGQCDYAYANGFMDAFAEFREQLRSQGQRHGKTVAINWPLWEEGGMKINAATIDWLKQDLGMLPLSTAEGIQAFCDALVNEQPQQIILELYANKEES